jgi:hypothetical protein
LGSTGADFQNLKGIIDGKIEIKCRRIMAGVELLWIFPMNDDCNMVKVVL